MSADRPTEIKLALTPHVIRAGARILSRMQGCEDPFGQQDYYEDLFKRLMKELAEDVARLVAEPS